MVGKRLSVSASVVGGLKPKGMAVKEAAQIRIQVVDSWCYSSSVWVSILFFFQGTNFQKLETR